MGVDARMYVTGVVPTQKQADDLAYDLGEAFGSSRFWIWDADDFSKTSRAVVLHVPDDADEWEPVRERGYEVRIATRYYGEGYERGDLPFVLAVARWMRDRLPGCVVWYGGDDQVYPLDAEREQALWNHFVVVGGKPYRSSWGEGSLCCGRPMRQYGFGGSEKFVCPGCGMRETRYQGQAFRDRSERKHDEWLKLAREGVSMTDLEHLGTPLSPRSSSGSDTES